MKVAYELARRNDVAGGIQVLKDAVKAAPKEPQPLVYLSQLYSKYLKKPDLALKYAEQAIALAPDNFNAHLAIFELHMAASQPKKAEEILDRAGKSKSADPKYWIQLGDLYTRLFRSFVWGSSCHQNRWLGHRRRKTWASCCQYWQSILVVSLVNATPRADHTCPTATARPFSPETGGDSLESRGHTPVILGVSVSKPRVFRAEQ